MQVVRAGRRVMGQFVLGPFVRAAELLASYQIEISFILKEESSVLLKSLFNVTKSKFILLVLIYN